MNSEKTTTRKGFLKRAGLAIAGAFAVTRAASSESKPESTNIASNGIASNGLPRAMSRVRPAKGAVVRNV